MSNSWLTPQKIAEQLGIDQGKVIGWIHAGELTAVNVAHSQATRPRWRIRQGDYDAFLSARQSHTPAPRAVRQRRSAEGVTQYF